MSLEQLWAGWRTDYVAGAAKQTGDESCVFCRLDASGPPSKDNLVIWRGKETFAVLNLYPYGTGHILCLPHRHESDLQKLSESESSELFSTIRNCAKALEVAYAPDGLNIGANLGRAAGAGIPAHLHFHVLARWSGDTNFMTSVAGVRVMPESLEVTWEKVVAAIDAVAPL